MSAELVVHITQRAAPAQAEWLVRLLGPVAVACRFERTPPVEIRPTGAAGGWCSQLRYAPDGRICISKKVCFWSAESVIYVVVHEWTHRLLQERGVCPHGPEFFCLNGVLLTRAAQFFDSDPLNNLSLYDLQDQPQELADVTSWRSLAFEWALIAMADVATSNATAEAVAAEVCARWASFVAGREADRVAAQMAAAAAIVTAQRRGARLEELTDSRSFWRMAAGAASGLFILSVWLFVRFS